MGDGVITVFLADDNLIVRAGVRALLAREADIEVVGVAADYDELLAAAAEPEPAGASSPTSACRRPSSTRASTPPRRSAQRHPGTGVVILSQYDDPEYAVSLLADGAAGYAYLLKDRVAEGDQLARRHPRGRHRRLAARPGDRRRARAPGAAADGDLSAADEELLDVHRRGPADQGHRRRPPHHAGGGVATPSSTSSSTWPRARRPAPTAPCGGCACSTRRSSTARSRARRSPGSCPAAWPRSSGSEGRHIGETEELEVTVLMSRHPRLLVDRRAHRPRPTSPRSSTSTGPR